MERAVALKKVGKLIGKGWGWRINERAPTAEEREAARLELPDAVAERNRLKEQREARMKAVLEADAEYQSLKVAHSAARQHADQLSGRMGSYRITVGKEVMGLFFSVSAQGDSWEEIIDKLTRKKD